MVHAPVLVGDALRLIEAAAGEENPDVANAVGIQLVLSAAAAAVRLPHEEPAGTPAGTAWRVLFVSDIRANPAAVLAMSIIAERYRVQAVIDAGNVADPATAGVPTRLMWRDEPVPYYLVPSPDDRSDERKTGVPMEVALASAGWDARLLDGGVAHILGLTVATAAYPADPSQRSARTERLNAEIGAYNARHPDGVDVAVVGEPTEATAVRGARTVLAGHAGDFTATNGADGSRVLMQGPTGGGGIRAALDPRSFQLSVLYVTESGILTGYDTITIHMRAPRMASVTRTVTAP